MSHQLTFADSEVGDFELLLCHGTVCVVGKMRDLILQLSKSSIYSTKPKANRHEALLCYKLAPHNARARPRAPNP